MGCTWSELSLSHAKAGFICTCTSHSLPRCSLCRCTMVYQLPGELRMATFCKIFWLTKGLRQWMLSLVQLSFGCEQLLRNCPFLILQWEKKWRFWRALQMKRILMVILLWFLETRVSFLLRQRTKTKSQTSHDLSMRRSWTRSAAMWHGLGRSFKLSEL